MIVDVRGTNTINKGAHLMLEAVVERLSGEFELSVPPTGSTYVERAKLGLLQTLHDYRSPRAFAAVANAAPAPLKRRYGLVADKDIRGVIDASGFAYSDSFGTSRIQREALFGRAWKRHGVPKIMLPQAFGPFNNPKTARWYRELLEQADLIFARDKVSADYLNSLGLSTPVQRSPDFTIALQGTPFDRAIDEPFAAIVPNRKMISDGGIAPEAYVENLVSYARAAMGEGLSPLFVVHERSDLEMANLVRQQIELPVFTHPDPRILKTVIGQAELVIGSRFHGIVASLSQGVKTVSLGWSHKYHELLSEFEVPEWLTHLEEDPSAAVARVLHDDDGLSRVLQRKPVLIDQVEQMWRQTIDTLNTRKTSPSGR